MVEIHVYSIGIELDTGGHWKLHTVHACRHNRPLDT